MGKINGGATRNLIIRGVNKARHTEESIREDLDHIHNLVVIKVEFIGNDCHIKTNSVNYALFARTCMMSRGYVPWAILTRPNPLSRVAAKPVTESTGEPRSNMAPTSALNPTRLISCQSRRSPNAEKHRHCGRGRVTWRTALRS